MNGVFWEREQEQQAGFFLRRINDNNKGLFWVEMRTLRRQSYERDMDNNMVCSEREQQQ